MLTLYQVISNGIDWHECADPLGDNISQWLVLAFCFYIAAMLYGLLNVVAGTILNSAMQAAEEERRHTQPCR